MNVPTPIPPLSLTAFIRVPMSLTNRDWWATVPAVHGWYVIETNAPVSVLASLSKRVPGKHYKLSNRIADAKFLIDAGLTIAPDKPDAAFVVYSGEHANLKARAREHTHGHTGTGCLCLQRYDELQKHDWSFLYRTCDEHAPGSKGNKGLRTLLEQRWRGANGWPVLCKQ